MKKSLQLKKTHIWEEPVNDWFKERMFGHTLNVCCGTSTIGDVRVDLKPRFKGILKGDMFNLSYEDNSFDVVICDPPWKLNPLLRPRNFFELVRVCKVGGRILFNARWIPTSKYVILKEIWLRCSYDLGDISGLMLFEKIQCLK